MKSWNRNLATLSLMIITVLSWTKIGAGQEALLGKKVLPLCHRECMPICMKVTEATQEICDGACQAGCVQLQGRGTGLSATDQGVDMRTVPAYHGWRSVKLFVSSKSRGQVENATTRRA
ncbi:hypothetical protein Bca101_052843 [Brassica carinata]